MKKPSVWIYLLFLCAAACQATLAQTAITVSPGIIEKPFQKSLKSGIYFHPKSEDQFNRYIEKAKGYNHLRLSAIESALNNSRNLRECLEILREFTPKIEKLRESGDDLLLVIAKMPPWLSSSKDSGYSSQRGWSILHTKPPADLNKWQTAVSEIVKLVKSEWGISAHYEIWNEPDLGYWTGSEAEYLAFYKATALAIRGSDTSALIGGPALNHWANGLDFHAPMGALAYSEAEKGLLGKLLAFAKAENLPLDFLSWHSFNLNYQEIDEGLEFIKAKCGNLGMNVPPVFISEWNAPSETRDGPIAAAFMPVFQFAMARPEIVSNQVAAWADFEEEPEEFHRGYGLNSYRGIEKPALYTLELSRMLRGNKVVSISNPVSKHYAAVSGEKLFVLVSNYAPPAILEALNEVLYEGRFTTRDLEREGFINVSAKNIVALENTYKFGRILPGKTRLDKAINNSMATFKFYDLLSRENRTFEVFIPSLKGKDVSAALYLVDAKENNNIFKYESLRINGLKHDQAIQFLLPRQRLESRLFTLKDGKFKISLMPNAVFLLEISLKER